jgi:cytochrome P450
MTITDVLNAGARGPATVQRYTERYGDASRPLAELARIEDPAFYVHPWPIYERLQAEAPVYYYEPFNTWILTKHADVQYAARHPELFSAAHGILLYDGVRHNSALGELFAGNGDMIGLTDPPRHLELRRIMQPPFTPTWLARLEPRIEAYCDQVLGEIVPGEPVNWTDTVASRLPALVIAAILGIPDDDEEFFARVRIWTDATEELASREQSAEELAATVAAFGSLNEFIGETFDRKRRCPADDFLSSLLSDHLDNEKLTEANQIGFAQLLIAAGADTSRSLLSELAAHFAIFPGQLDLLRADRSLVPNAIEEVLRFAPAAHGFARQAVQDVTLQGQQITSGQRVWLAYEAANRDPDVFDRPNEFDIRRPSNRRNVTFGFGTHVCIAAPLVRMETRILLQKLVTRFSRFEFAGPGQRAESSLRNGWVELPMVFHP